MTKYNIIPLKDSLIIKADVGEKKVGSFILAGSTRDAQAPDRVEVVRLGEGAFNDQEVKPKVGDMVVIAKYDGIVIESVKEGSFEYEYRVIHDTRIRALLEEVKE